MDITETKIKLTRITTLVRDSANKEIIRTPAQWAELGRELNGEMMNVADLMADLEHEYKVMVSEIQFGGKSATAAKNEAEASMAYRNWRYMTFIWGRADEQVKLIKKSIQQMERDYVNL